MFILYDRINVEFWKSEIKLVIKQSILHCDISIYVRRTTKFYMNKAFLFFLTSNTYTRFRSVLQYIRMHTCKTCRDIRCFLLGIYNCNILVINFTKQKQQKTNKIKLKNETSFRKKNPLVFALRDYFK